MSPYPKVDCHSHYLPTEYRKALAENGHKNPDGMPAIPEWSEESHLAMMKSINVTKSVLSISTPGVHLKAGDDALARKLARHVNEVAADLKKRMPDQFGFFASLPLPDVEGTLQEISHAMDHLNADGFVVLTNFHGTYLGHKDLDAVFDELNRRKAVVFIHPTTPCLSSGTAATPLPQFPRPMFEFLFDSARAVINLFLTGTVKRCPHITFHMSHVGGAFPPLINRFSSVAEIMKLGGSANEVSPAWVKERLNTQFYFDTAGWAFPEQAKGLLEYVTVDRMLFGSDFPYTPLPVVQALSKQHDEYLPQVFASDEDKEKLCSKNALQLFNKVSSKLS
ncbi:hypothetical protein AYL99_09199 [Fonsecaea erecta]|uniref:6-methylsalicylate decarboxylase n=1 Tax=Fonsecaea erecta TaxID=1367422 RepID=A0A178ZC85_9EURO|nr:hypothetical protein AYL99_09199 [Fonsecaea erecta]OAP57086.1 hypothetical protein AYL99_09199 [Fonsecaea erecta]